uniref:(northern house mosquito) hypothetical protein n=1 Tax=Culex pipiens TaxID=7175 RepID=A0A8D8EZQ4_CULPI
MIFFGARSPKSAGKQLVYSNRFSLRHLVRQDSNASVARLAAHIPRNLVMVPSLTSIARSSPPGVMRLRNYLSCRSSPAVDVHNPRQIPLGNTDTLAFRWTLISIARGVVPTCPAFLRCGFLPRTTP